jgi:hypothetical protein
MDDPRSRGKYAASMVCVLLGGGALGYLAAQQRSPSSLSGESPNVIADTPALLVAVRDLARLESVSFHMERVIDLKQRQARIFGLIEADDAILLIAAGDVVAGLDLSKMRDGDVEVDPQARRARVRLPPVEILSAHLDNRRTYVHSRKTDLLAQPNVAIETEARQHAEESIRSAALEAGILERARANAQQTIHALVRSLGFDHIELHWRE